MPDHSVVHRYARCLSYPEWGVGTVNGIYFTGDGDDIQQWARVSFHVGIRTVPAGSLQFVDFSKPDPGADRVQRFMTAAKHALAEGDFALAAQRLVYARDAEPRNTAGAAADDDSPSGRPATTPPPRRAVRDWIRAEGERPAPHRYRRAHLRGHGLALARPSTPAERETERAPARRGGVGAARPAAAAHASTARARATRSSARGRSRRREQGLLDLALVAHLLGDVGAEVSACEQATALAPDSAAAWSRYAHALARTDRTARVPGRVRARARAGATTPRSATCASRCSAAAPRELAQQSAAA